MSVESVLGYPIVGALILLATSVLLYIASASIDGTVGPKLSRLADALSLLSIILIIAGYWSYISQLIPAALP
ncbi:MAG: hypothetical protein GXO09_01885 [Crenarchaeota archaeon]|nr:hypothetical protein [Thermoproteota archaeon]